MWRIEQQIMGVKFGIVKYNVLKCLDSVQEMIVTIDKFYVDKGFKVKSFVTFEDSFAYFILETFK